MSAANLWDTLRLIIVVGGLAVCVGGVRMIARTVLPARMTLCAGLLCLAVSAVGREIEHFGDGANYRLFFSFAGVLLAGGGIWLARSEP